MLGFVFGGLLIGACTKEDIFETRLALMQKDVIVNKEASQARVLVFSSGKWNITVPAESSDWLSIDKTEGYGNGSFVLTYTDNTNQPPRKAEIRVSGGGITQLVTLRQKGYTIIMNIATDTTMITSKAVDNVLSMQMSNVAFSDVSVKVNYLDTARVDWLSEVTYDSTAQQLLYHTTRNMEMVPRMVRLSFKYMDAVGIIYSDSVIVKQAAATMADNAPLVTFPEVLALPNGVYTENKKIRGVVISPLKNENLMLWKESGVALSSETNDRTVYIQDAEGNGFRLETASSADNNFIKGQTVDLWLKDLVIWHDTIATGAVTLRNVKVTNIVETSYLIPLPEPKIRTVAQLTDADVNTLVKLVNVEFPFKEGCLTNMNEGYYARVGMIPQVLVDANGDAISLLTNTKVPYRRLLRSTGTDAATTSYVVPYTTAANNSQLPQGKGDVTGVLVAETYPRYPNISKYSIRHFNKDDIAISASADNSMINFICNFDLTRRFPTKASSDAGYKWWKMPIGNGWISHSTVILGTQPFLSSLYKSLQYTKTGVVDIYLNTDKGQQDSSSLAVTAAQTWTGDNANFIILKFPSKDISTQGLRFFVSMYVGFNGSNTFFVDYASSCQSNTVWTTFGRFKSPNQVDWSNGGRFPIPQAPGPDLITFALPAQVANNDTTYIRIIPQDKSGLSNAGIPNNTGNGAAQYYGNMGVMNLK